VNGYAEIKHTTFSQTDPSWLLHTDSFNSTVAQAVEQTLRTFDSVFCVPCIPTVHSAQSPTVQSTGIELRGSFDVKKLSTYLDSILYSDAKSVGGEIFRIKGLLHVSSHSNYFLLQAVHDIFDITETEVAVDASLGELVNKIVVIGRGLVIEDLRAGFMSCLAT
jgi:G3E family GTPase